jgi:hypothetical protein
VQVVHVQVVGDGHLAVGNGLRAANTQESIQPRKNNLADVAPAKQRCCYGAPVVAVGVMPTPAVGLGCPCVGGISAACAPAL